MFNFSIITVVRNDKSGLIQTQKSLISQTYNNYEWLIIDGNSSDGTKEYVNSLEYNFLNVLSEPDEGIYDAMNKGIKLCKNDYVLFLNAGDTFYDNETLFLVNHHISNSKEYVDVLFGGANIFFNSKDYIYRKPIELEKSIKNGLPGHHQATYYSKKILNEILYDLNFVNSGDYAIIAKMYMFGIKTSIINQPLTLFFVGHNSYKNIFKILYNSTIVQKDILNMNFFEISISFFKRFFSSFIVILLYRFPYFFKVFNFNTK